MVAVCYNHCNIVVVAVNDELRALWSAGAKTCPAIEIDLYYPFLYVPLNLIGSIYSAQHCISGYEVALAVFGLRKLVCVMERGSSRTVALTNKMAVQLVANQHIPSVSLYCYPFKLLRER